MSVNERCIGKWLAEIDQRYCILYKTKFENHGILSSNDLSDLFRNDNDIRTFLENKDGINITNVIHKNRLFREINNEIKYLTGNNSINSSDDIESHYDLSDMDGNCGDNYIESIYSDPTTLNNDDINDSYSNCDKNSHTGQYNCYENEDTSDSDDSNAGIMIRRSSDNRRKRYDNNYDSSDVGNDLDDIVPVSDTINNNLSDMECKYNDNNEDKIFKLNSVDFDDCDTDFDDPNDTNTDTNTNDTNTDDTNDESDVGNSIDNCNANYNNICDISSDIGDDLNENDLDQMFLDFDTINDYENVNNIFTDNDSHNALDNPLRMKLDEFKGYINEYNQKEVKWEEIKVDIINDDNLFSDIEYNDSNGQAIVIDNGSGTIKAGFAGSNSPATVFPTILELNGFNQKSETESSHTHPIKRGIVTDWNAMETIYDRAFNKLKVSPSEQPFLSILSPNNPQSNHEISTKLMFEQFNVPQYYISNQACLSLYATGHLNGLVIDSGYDLTYSLSIYDGFHIPKTLSSIPFGGNDINQYFKEYLSTYLTKEPQYLTEYESKIAINIKENIGYIATDFIDELECNIEREYTLPDGKIISFGNESFKYTESLFEPSILNLKHNGIHQIAYNTIQKCCENKRNDMYGNILLIGGSTLFKGFESRLKHEMSLFASKNNINTDVNIISPKDRKHFAWIGGSILASLSSFNEMWITKDEYSENGESIVNRKCIT